jgi:hypothetical protein
VRESNSVIAATTPMVQEEAGRSRKKQEEAGRSRKEQEGR